MSDVNAQATYRLVLDGATLNVVVEHLDVDGRHERWIACHEASRCVSYISATNVLEQLSGELGWCGAEILAPGVPPISAALRGASGRVARSGARSAGRAPTSGSRGG